MIKRLVLASASPRRCELLKYISDDFSVIVSDCEEVKSGMDAEDMVKENARAKAGSVFADNRDALVIGADTVVVIDGDILGKPESRDEAAAFLRRLSGRSHHVMTGVCIMFGDEERVFCEKTRVTFADLTDEEIEDCLNRESFLDKAGAYAIQGVMAKHITGVEGCFYNVIGLPVSRIYSELKDMGLM